MANDPPLADRVENRMAVGRHGLDLNSGAVRKDARHRSAALCEERQEGVWIAVPLPDLGRNGRGQVFEQHTDLAFGAVCGSRAQTLRGRNQPRRPVVRRLFGEDTGRRDQERDQFEGFVF
jgi:hypothetical protein